MFEHESRYIEGEVSYRVADLSACVHTHIDVPSRLLLEAAHKHCYSCEQRLLGLWLAYSRSHRRHGQSVCSGDPVHFSYRIVHIFEDQGHVITCMHVTIWCMQLPFQAPRLCQATNMSALRNSLTGSDTGLRLP